MPQENDEGEAQKVNGSEESARMSRQTEPKSQGVKRKRKRSSQGEPQPKKQKSSPLPTLELPNNSRASSLEEEDGDDGGNQRSTTRAPSRTPNEMLTSISKKNRKVKRRRVVPPQANKDQDEHSNHREPEDSEASEEDETRSHAGTESELTCTICGRQFRNQQHLTRHMRNPNVHKKRHTCECTEGFFREDDLKRHQRDSGHKSRVGPATGPFTDKEKAKLTRFKRRICNDYSVSEFDFNTLMTLLGRRDGSEWPNPDVTRAELRGMFYDVLPDRSRKSLNRYRERYFQNVEQDTEWTEEQINDLRNLVQEKGRKWVEIAEILGRTQDSVYQKWKNRIRQGDAQRFERWEEGEKEALIMAVRECKTAAKVPLDFSSDDKVNWTAVSDRLGKTRNAQQCSTFWKRVYRPREEAKARGQDIKPLPSGRSKPEPAKARHQTRRTATRDGKSVEVITPRRKIKSAMYVTDSDEENNVSVGNTQLKNVNQKSSLEAHSMTSSQGTESEQDQDGVEEADTEKQERSHEDEDEDRSDNNGEIDSSSKRPQRKRLIEVLIPPPASSKHFPEQQTTLNGSFQAVNRRNHESDQPPSHNRTNLPIESEAVPLRSSQTPKTPRLPSISKRTPRQVTTLSQAFNNTQAPTSARTAGRSTPSMHSREDQPSPKIQIQPRPLLEEELSVLEPEEEDDSQAQQQQEPREHRVVEFSNYDSEAEDSNEERPPEMFSSAAPPPDGVESETASDSESQSSDDDEQPPQMFSSVATGVQKDLEAVESGSEESEEEEPPLMFSSAPLPLPLPNTARQAHNANGSDTEEAEEDDEPPPEMFTSALPDHDPAARSEASSSSGDAPTIFPDESDSNDGGPDESNTGTGHGTDSGVDGDQSMVDAAQGDFFANLEASARKVRSFRQDREREREMKLKLRNVNVGRKSGEDGAYGSGNGTAEGGRSRKRGTKKKKKEVFDVSSSDEEEEEW
ncbi:hypothetical protein EPUS_07303 [Endocarpon pusillum Z07020]|uniref:Uncharacterized protein n=1 Tax=Endocarpon pusillum (strain Z07020 / HMAS-L-300199) TaxID=1263415 RepID=U1GVB8_ENDPU|nr:uncharacterized protein EPUS_07303 [Endocarpon pusillum Z07020]ERF76423.1 hypothetical protein EPUS_07303 [Endocarpon pusillum Z07020]